MVDPGGAQIARSDVVMSVLEIPVEAAAQAMALGRKHGVRTILNPAPATELDESVLQHVDYLTPNESELRILLGLAPDDPTPTVVLAEELRARGVRNLIVTMGEQGALILTEGAQEAIPGGPGRRCGHDRRRGCLQRRPGRCAGRGAEPGRRGPVRQPLRRNRLSEIGRHSGVGHAVAGRTTIRRRIGYGGGLAGRKAGKMVAREGAIGIVVVPVRRGTAEVAFFQGGTSMKRPLYAQESSCVYVLAGQDR